MKIYVFLADGFEEIEAIAVIDILRRAGIDVCTVSITGKTHVCAAHQITVQADVLFDDADFSDAGLLFLPGGMPGTTHLDAHVGLRMLIQTHFDAHKPLAAICAAPLVFGKMGLLKGREAICYPGFENYLEGAVLSASDVVVSGNIITGKGPGVAVDFGLALVRYCKGEALVADLERAMCIKK